VKETTMDQFSVRRATKDASEIAVAKKPITMPVYNASERNLKPSRKPVNGTSNRHGNLMELLNERSNELKWEQQKKKTIVYLFLLPPSAPTPTAT
ncbi:hypothetical protein HK104_000434, partial [Borealophlyctis nickersoniae]